MKPFSLKRRLTVLFLVIFSIALLIPSGAISVASASPVLHKVVAMPNVNTNAWSPLGPAPLDQTHSGDPADSGNASGRITAIAVNPANSKELWIGAADGGIWHSTDGGRTWTPQTDTQVSLAIGSIAVDPSTPETLYAGTGEANNNGDAFVGAGILKSTDSGQTWTTLGSSQFTGLNVGKIVVDPTNPNLILAAVSANGTETPSSKVGNAGIWRSTDGGTKWTQVLAGQGTDILFNPKDPTILYAGVASATTRGIYRSLSKGLKWKLLTSSALPSSNTPFDRIALGISNDGENLAALFANGSALVNNDLYISTASTVRKVGTSKTWATKSVAATLGKADTQWDYDIFIAFDPSDMTDQTLYAGGINFWKSTNGGTQFANILQGSGVHVDQHAIAFFSSSSPSFYLGNDGGIWSYTNSGFTDLNAGGLNITQFYSGTISTADPTNCGCAQLYAGAQDNGVDQYMPNQTSHTYWNEVDGGDGGIVISDYTNRATVYATFPKQTADDGSIVGVIEQSTDGGATWNQIVNGLNLDELGDESVPPLAMSSIDNTRLYTGTTRVYVYEELDNQMTWVPLSGTALDNSELQSVAVAPTDDNTIYAGTANGNIFTTTQGGCSDNSCWSKSTPNASPVSSIAVDPLNSNIVYVSYPNYQSAGGKHIYMSETGGSGNNWIDISTTLPNIPVYSVAVSPVDGSIIAGTSIGVYQGIDTSNAWTWTRLGTGLPNVVVEQVFFDHSGTTLYAATHGRGVWSMPLSLTASWRDTVGNGPSAGIVADSPTDIWAVGGSSNNLSIENWNGQNWSDTPTDNPGPDGNFINGITTVPATGDAWAAGGAEYTDQNGNLITLPLIEHWSGSIWTALTVPNDGGNGTFHSISASSAKNVWAAGGSASGTLMEHWDGSTWVIDTGSFIPNATYNGVDAISPDNVWAVGYQGGQAIAMHWDGLSWTNTNPINPQNAVNSFAAITAVSANNIWAVGLSATGDSSGIGLVEHWDGSTWSQVTVPVPAGTLANTLLGITHIPGTNQLWITDWVEDTQSVALIHYDGTNWSVTVPPQPAIQASKNVVSAITSTTENNVFAVGFVQNDIDGSSSSLVERYSP